MRLDVVHARSFGPLDRTRAFRMTTQQNIEPIQRRGRTGVSALRRLRFVKHENHVKFVGVDLPYF